MDPVTAQLLQHLSDYGPWLLFALAVLETCFLTGLVIPSGLAVSVATVLALEESMTLLSVVVAALAGGALGDTVGFWVGRAAGDRVMSGGGRWARLASDRQAEMKRFFGRHPLYSVSLARLVSFVRTLMPFFAGMSRIPFHRFLAYEAVGLVGWVGIYMAIGVLAQASWEGATKVVGLGGAVAFALGGAVLWTLFRRRRRRRSEAQHGGGT